MPKGSEELTKERENEIIDACKKLYRTMSFKEITIKEIGKTTSFTRTSIYNYFQTKEEIFLALLQREYEHWNIDLRSALRKKTSMSRMDFAILLAETLSKRELMLKLLSMNMYDIDFKQVYGESLNLTAECASRCIPELSEEDGIKFLYAFFPFVYGIYPYSSITPKQKAAMEAAGVPVHCFSIYDMTLSAAKKLLEIDE